MAVVRIALVVLVCCFASATRADASGLLPGLRGDDQPCSFDSVPTSRPPGAETRVELGIRVLDLIDVDDAKQTLSLDFVLSAHWQDPRLGQQVGELGSCTLPLDRVWDPALALDGERDIRLGRPQQVVVSDDGTVRYVQRFIGTVRSTGNLRDFPFDAREFAIQIVAVGYSPDEVVFVMDEEQTDFLPDPSVTDWTLGEQAVTVEPYALEGGSRSLASIRFATPANRRAGFFLNRLGVPALLIVMMSWISFWIPPDAFAPRLSLGALSMLNAIAFQLVLLDMLPPVSYLTRADWIASGVNILIFAALLESAAAGILCTRGRAELALRLDRLSRVAAPVTLIGLLALSMAL